MFGTRARRGAAGIALVLALGACTSGGGREVASLGGRAAADPTPAASVDPEDARLAFAECMRERGVDMPDPGSGAGGGEDTPMLVGGSPDEEEEFLEAEEACRHHLEGVIDEPNEEQQQEFEDAALAFAKCMRDNGVEDHPDPEFEDGGMTIEISGDDVMADPDFEAAEEECRKLLPGAGPEVQEVAP